MYSASEPWKLTSSYFSSPAAIVAGSRVFSVLGGDLELLKDELKRLEVATATKFGSGTQEPSRVG